MEKTEKISKDLIADATELMSAFKSDAFFSQRQKAFERWGEVNAPTTRDEYWKYTRVQPLLKKKFNVDQNVKDIAASNKSEGVTLTFVNGVFDPNQSSSLSEDQIQITHLDPQNAQIADAVEGAFESQEDYFSLLNDSFYTSGLFIQLGKNKVVEETVHVRHLLADEDRLINIKNIIQLAEGSSVKVKESWENLDGKAHFINNQLHADIAGNADFEMIKVQSVGKENALIDQCFIDIARDARSTVHTISTEGKMIRNNLNASLNGENGSCYMNGLYMTKDKQHVDNHTRVIHAVPNCYSNELYKGILNDSSRGVFNGKVVVERDAQKTNAFQFNGNILLTDNAEINSKPELEIYADDVKCSHGSTTGQLDEEALFYLQSRGISRDSARNLLVYAFAKEVLEKISQPEIREEIDAYLSERYHIVKDE